MLRSQIFFVPSRAKAAGRAHERRHGKGVQVTRTCGVTAGQDTLPACLSFAQPEGRAMFAAVLCGDLTGSQGGLKRPRCRACAKFVCSVRLHLFSLLSRIARVVFDPAFGLRGLGLRLKTFAKRDWASWIQCVTKALASQRPCHIWLRKRLDGLRKEAPCQGAWSQCLGEADYACLG